MKTSIPFFSLQRQWSTLKAPLTTAINQILDDQQYIGGKSVEIFEQTLAAYTGTQYAISCNSGTDALWLALKALDIQKNDIVLTTPYSFIASSSEIIAHEANPVFLDVDQTTYNLSPEALESWLENHALIKDQKTIDRITLKPIVGIVTVNLFGQCADYDRIRAIADKWHLWIIEDAAQSIGSHINGKQAGSLGDIACFSFYPTKNLGAFGDAGALTTQDAALAEKIKILRNHGRTGQYIYTTCGINSRMDGIQAAVLQEKLKFLAQWNARRRDIAAQYKKLLGNIRALVLPQEVTGYHTYHQYSLRVLDNTRDALAKTLSDHQIGYNIFYPHDFTQIPFLSPDPALNNDCPIARTLTTTMIALPIWPELLDTEIEYIAGVIQKFFNQDHPMQSSTTTQAFSKPS